MELVSDTGTFIMMAFGAVFYLIRILLTEKYQRKTVQGLK
ncbi:hypothetical protein JMA_02300 [Jeotgalibacillus malaysiensis]|uniref:Uncharacterized protein n=1 Tax=Jeotgalibacillus malaysiensis TaxID=1508404 RepID=A0A0B5ALF4_9BACL|nr:hypothetical protein JMA_02300 [Jeotgalibacillus malaysiensis]